MMSIIAIVAAVLLSGPAAVESLQDVGVVWRHQFQYILLEPTTVVKQHLVAFWRSYANDYNISTGTVQSFSFGGDLGLGSVLFPGSNLTNADFGGRINFVSKEALQAYWDVTYTNRLYVGMLKKYVKSADRLQYLAKPTTLAKGTYYRTAFQYGLTNNYTSDQIQSAVELWTDWVQHSPVAIAQFGVGADLGISKTFYPTANAKLGGSVTFKTEDQLKAFWKYLYPKAAYKSLVAGFDTVSRLQYAALYA